MKMKLTKMLMIFVAIVVISGGLTVYAASTLFTQNFPTQTFGTPLLSGCATLTSSVLGAYQGMPSTIGYYCGTNPAFSLATGVTSLTVVPMFTAPSGWVLGIGLGGCPTGVTNSGVTNLTSGQSVTLTFASYNYCLFSSSATNITSPWSITWSTA